MRQRNSTSSRKRQTWTGAILLLAMQLCTGGASAQLTVAPQTDLQQLAASISGPGVTISNPVITCHALGFGEYSYSGSGMGLTEGVLLTSGRITDALGPNNNAGSTNSFQQGTPGDPLLDAVTGRTTRDACKLEFDIIPTGDSLRFEFTFGSEEYNEWVGSQYNDVFGFFISGPGITGDPGAGDDHNIALIPGTGTAVTINNINNGSNPGYYQDNTGGSPTQYDGYTTGLAAQAVVQPCQSYHLKLIIADATDRKFDSGVFIERIQSPTITLSTYTQNGTPNMVEGCNPGWIRFSRGSPRPVPITLQYFLQGTATNGTDFMPIGSVNPAVAKSITIPANASHVDRPVNPIADNVSEPDEFIHCILGNPNCPSVPLDIVDFWITDSIFTTLSPGGTICTGESWPFTVTGGANFSWTPATGLSCTNCPNPVASPATTTTYTVTITDGTCTRTFNRQVRVSNLSLSAIVTHPLCNGGSNGAINLTPSAGIAPLSYSWTGPNGFTASSQDITNLLAGTYTVTVTDAACTRTQSWNVINPATLSVALIPAILPFGQNIACHGGTTGSINSIITGGTAPFAISWTGPGGFSANTDNISALGAGNYIMNVTDAHGCSAMASTTLVESPPISFSASTTQHVLCFGANIGAAGSSVSGGIPPYSYSWNSSPQQTTANASGLAPGDYMLTLIDAYNCSASANVTIGGPTAALTTTMTAQTNVLCFGNSTGSASIGISGGTAAYSTTWNTSPVQSGNSASNLPAGIWTATVTDANGCTTTRNVTITQPASAMSATLFAQTNVNCFGNSTGSATVSVSGGTGPYTYQWNTVPAQNTATANNLPAGNHTCTVRDVNLCVVPVNVTITQPAAVLSTTIASQNNILCFGSSTGSAAINVSGGTSPYTCAWNTTPAQNTATATGLPAGTWTCTVTDASGCTTTRNVTLTQPVANLSASISAQANVLCFGNNTGSATVTASGGTGPYSFTWNTSPVQNSATANNLPAGSYICTVMDSNGCTTTASVTITQPGSALSANLSAQTNVLCFGNITGSATANASGGTAPYAYSWNSSPAQSTATASNLPAGTYTCTITDVNGCATSIGATITQPASALSASIGSQTNVLCFGNTTGSASVNASGGTGAIGYSWNTSPAQTTATATGLGAGTYTCTITDASGCTRSVNATISQPAAVLGANISGQTNVLCSGSSTGSATVSVSGGTGAYSYSWSSSPAQTTSTATGLVAGTYACTITDANGCVTSVSTTITQPTAALSASLASQMNVGCFGLATGSATLNASGGTGAISYQWNTTPIQASETATGLTAGNYTCTVRDANNCTVTVNVTISQPVAALSASISGHTDVLCSGDNTGSATVDVNGGTGTYSYSWTTTPAQTTSSASNLSAGSWTCTITDGNGCSTTTSALITQPAAMIAIAGSITPATCGGASDGEVDATVTGGTGTYSHAWNGPGGFAATTQDISALTSGVYSLEVTDANGCTSTSSFNVAQPGFFSVSGTPATYTGGWNVSCSGGNNGAIDMTLSGGTSPYSHAWTGPGGFTSTTEDINSLQAGVYTYVLTDDNGCSISASFTLTQPPAITFITNSTQPITCAGDANAAASVSGSGGTAPLGYTWSGPDGFNSGSPSINGLQVGTYTLVVSDANGCTDGGTNQFTFLAPPTLMADPIVTSNVHCFGNATGSATVNPSGGVSPYTISWNTQPVQTGTNATGLTAGTYTVTITDARGCTRTQDISITQPAGVLTASINTQTNVLIFGQQTGNATVTAAGGSTPYTYQWSNGQTNATAIGLAAGSYAVTVTDASGCTATADVTITQPGSALSASISGQTDVLCFGNSTGSATVTANGGTPAYSFEWNSIPVQNGATAIDLPAGIHTCTVTDANGASTTASITITQPATALSATIGSQTEVDCFGNATGSATASAMGGTPLYSYSWNTAPVQSTATAMGLAFGTWTCTITDANGCVTNIDASISGPAAALSATIAAQTPVDCFGGANGSASVSATDGTTPYTYTWSDGQTTATANGLVAGNYSCTVTDGNGCVTSTAATITQPAAALSANISGITQATCGMNNGGSMANVSGGTAPFGYGWDSSPVQNTAMLTGAGPGTYTCTITDVNGCATTATATITSPNALAIQVLTTTAQTCSGTANGQATVAASGGNTPYTYLWNTSPAQSGATASGMIAGSYIATVTDANGCSANANAIITGPASPLTLTNSSTVNVLCNGQNTGAATVNATGGLEPYSIVWNTVPAQTGNTATGLLAGTYTATVTDAFGCVRSTTVDITQPVAAVDGYVDASQNVSCFGGSDAFATIEVSGGSGNYSIEWNTTPVQTGPTATGLTAGTWFATILDNNGCTTPKLLPLTIGGPAAPLALEATTSNYFGSGISCLNATDGSINVSTSGGTAAYTYAWSGPNGFTSSNEDLSALAAGTYNLLATDANGCSASLSRTLIAPTIINATANIMTATCGGASNGGIDLNASGGVAPYTFAWTGQSGFTATTEDINGLSAGPYQVSITGANGCQRSFSFNVSEPGLFNVTAALSDFNGSNLSCATSSNGVIDATISGGTLPYNHQWSGPSGFSATTEDINSLPAGTYTLNITDANGCNTLAEYTLVAPPTLFTALVPQVYAGGGNVSCGGATDGAIDGTIGGGTPGFTFNWTGPNGYTANTEDITGLAPGTYTMTVQDTNGCSASQSTTLTSPIGLNVGMSVSQYNSGDAVNCNGSLTGIINLGINGGLAPYQVDWSGPNGFTSTAIDISSLAAGTYTATISDAAGCDTTITVTLTEPAPVVISSVVSDFNGYQVGCSGSTDGSIDLNVSGGAGNYIYQWSGSNAFVSINEDATGLEAGTYHVMISDLNGCKSFLDIELEAPPAINASAVIASAACQGSDDGGVDLAVIGGVAPYTLQWNGPGGYNSMAEDLSGLFAGIYTVNISDANGCAYSTSFDVNEPGVFAVSATSMVYPGGYGVSCNGASDGAIDLTASGGTAPHFVAWQGPGGFTAITEDISGLAAGTYNMTVTDANGCAHLASWTITSPTPINIGLAASQFADGSNVACSGGGNGSINATIIGGAAPYTIAWNGPNGFIAIDEDLTNLSIGTYSISIMDAIGCSASSSITLTEPTPININVATSQFISGGNVSCEGEGDGSIDLTLSGGSLIYLINWAGPSGFQSNNQDIFGLAAGTYNVTVTDANACTATANATLIAPNPIIIDLDVSQYGGGYSIGCNGSTGDVNAQVQGGAVPWTYAWTGPNGFTSTAPNLDDVAAGTYDLVVTDAAGCTASASITLTEPTVVDMTANVSTVGNGYEVGCAGNDGSISLSVSGGMAPYIIDWSGSNGFASLNEDLTGLPADTYNVSITDLNGCVSTASFTLDQAAELSVGLNVSGNVCDGLDDGAIDLGVNGGVPSFTFAWSGPEGFSSTNEDISGLAGGTYVVDIVDANGCTAQANATIAASAPIDVSVYVSDYGDVNIPCAGVNSGVIEATLSGGAGSLNILWSGPNGFASTEPFLSGLEAGEYTLSVSDLNGCALDTQITIVAPADPIGAGITASIQPSGSHVSCFGGNDGSLDLTVSGGTGPYDITWHGPQGSSWSTEDPTGLVAGHYDVVIVDTHGCSFTDSIALTGPDSALAAIITLSQFNGGFQTSCDGTVDGHIQALAVGGSGGYQISWIGPDGFTSTSDSIAGLQEGSYTLLLTDVNGCTLTEEVLITAPEPITWELIAASLPGGSNISCNGLNDGAISASVSGGSGTYTNTWTGPQGYSASGPDISGLHAGEYCITIMDGNGCTAADCITISEPGMLDVSATASATDCGQNNGSVDASVSGGTAPYTHLWSNGALTEDITGVPVASYSILVTDANGCQDSTTVVVSEGAALSGNATVADALCQGEANGGIDLSMTTGGAPFSFSWTGGSSDEDMSGLPAGSYQVHVTDANGCTWSQVFTVNEPAAISAESAVMTHANGYNVSAPGSADGSIALEVTGGTVPYTYLWSNGATGSVVEGLAVGGYSVTITDANGCSRVLEFVLTGPDGVEMPTGFTPNGDGQNDLFVIHGLENHPENQLLVFNRWGNVVYDRLNYKNDWGGENFQGQYLPNGTYFIILRLGNDAMNLQGYVDLRR